MSLNWDASNTLLPWGAMDEHQQTRCMNLAWVCMALGIKELTDDNVETFLARQEFYNRAFANSGGLGQPYGLTELRDFVGYWTNVTPETDTKWRNRIAERAFEKIAAEVSRYAASLI